MKSGFLKKLQPSPQATNIGSQNKFAIIKYLLHQEKYIFGSFLVSSGTYSNFGTVNENKI